MRVNYIKDLRKQKKMTQGDLAKKCGVSRATICSLETGKHGAMTLDTLFSIADALDVTIDRIFFKPSV